MAPYLIDYAHYVLSIVSVQKCINREIKVVRDHDWEIRVCIGCICQSVGSGGAVEVASVRRSWGSQVPDIAGSGQLQLGVVEPSSQDGGTSVENYLQKGKILNCGEEKNVRKNNTTVNTKDRGRRLRRFSRLHSRDFPAAVGETRTTSEQVFTLQPMEDATCSRWKVWGARSGRGELLWTNCNLPIPHPSAVLGVGR